MYVDEFELERQEAGRAWDAAYEADQRADRAEALAAQRDETIKSLLGYIGWLTCARDRGWSN